LYNNNSQRIRNAHRSTVLQPGLDTCRRFLPILAAILLPVLLAPAAGAEPPGAALRLAGGSLSGPLDTAGLPASLRQTRADLIEGGPALLRFAVPMTPELRRAATRAGVRLEACLGDRGFIAYLPQGVWNGPSRCPDWSGRRPTTRGCASHPRSAPSRARIPASSFR
jgi:hypothetical protein